MKKTMKKLQLGRETVRTLRASELRAVAGGSVTGSYSCANCTNGSCYCSFPVGC